MSVRVQVKHLSAVAIAQINPLEDDWTSWVIARAKEHGWMVHHARPARTANGWRTPVQGHKGAPDLLLARDGDVLVPELKRDGTYPDPDQRAWQKALGPRGEVWRPRDAVAVLARLARPAAAA